MKTIEVCFGRQMTVFPTDPDGEIEIHAEALLYATPAQADAVAVALVQASPITDDDRAWVDGFGALDSTERLTLGLALIRSARP